MPVCRQYLMSTERMVSRLRSIAVLPLFVIAATGGALLIGECQPSADAAEESALREAAGWIQQAGRVGSQHDAQYDYEMTCRVRLLLFWAGRDDVGGGYVRIRRAAGIPGEQVIQVLFGSDPVKAPRGINRWGAGTEVLRESARRDQAQASAFFGFMKSSKGQSVGAMQRELSKEKSNGRYLFEGIISRVDRNAAMATTVPFVSSKDFDLHQYPEVESAALKQLESGQDRKTRHLEGTPQVRCQAVGGFLSTMLQLTDDAVDGKTTPRSLCYLYNARHYTATLLSARSLAERSVHYTLRQDGRSVDYSLRNLKEARFEVTGEETRNQSAFTILLGTEGALRGAPIQINYQPNWWFQIVLNLIPGSSQD